MPPIDVVALGESMYEFSQVPGQPRHYLQGFGGDTANCAVAAARQGARVAYITKLGDDPFGREFLSMWQYVNAAAALTTTGFDAIAPLQHADSVQRFLAQQ